MRITLRNRLRGLYDRKAQRLASWRSMLFVARTGHAPRCRRFKRGVRFTLGERRAILFHHKGFR